MNDWIEKGMDDAMAAEERKGLYKRVAAENICDGRACGKTVQTFREQTWVQSP
jgi:hypothetical protein